MNDRDFDKNPYSKDEQRVAQFFFDRGVGGGDDPIEALIVGYQYLVHERNELRAQLAGNAQAPWQPIETAPFQRTVILCRIGEQLCVTAYRFGPAAGWRHAHSSDSICFEPTHWTNLPAPLAVPSTMQLCPDWRTCKCKDGCAHSSTEHS